MKTRVIRLDEFSAWLYSMPVSPVVAILFGGDRLSCCDEAVVLEVNGQIVGAATIAPEGEMGTNLPAIVGLYVLLAHRRHGYGAAIMRAAVERCRERGFARVCVDIMSTGAKRAVERLPKDLRAMLDIHDQGAMMDMF